MPKITFILPVYNVEKYLPKAIESIKGQTMNDWEAILVNDGSMDNCGFICDKAAENDSRFKVIHKENGGAASAKNAGLDVASGEYIHFFDPDDWIEPKLAEETTKIADENKADIVFFGTFLDTVDGNLKLISSAYVSPPIKQAEREEPCKRLFGKIVDSHLMPLKIFRRSLIEKGPHRFPPKAIGEDGMFFTNVYRESPKCIAGIDKGYYHYIKRKGSASLSFHQERLNDNFYLTKEIAKTVEKWGLTESKEHIDALKYSALRDLQLATKNISYSKKPFFEQVKILKKIMKNERIRKVVADVSLKRVGSRNDKIKLFFLKAHMYSLVLLLSDLNK